jgi:hypothetical protein
MFGRFAGAAEDFLLQLIELELENAIWASFM